MAKIIYQSSNTENLLLLGVRESFVRPLNLGTWNQVRVGMLFNYTSATGDSGSVTLETVSVLSNSDRIYFGLKSDGSDFPGTSGTNFIGAMTVTTSSMASTARAGQTVSSVTHMFAGASSGSAGIYAPTSGTGTTTSIETNNAISNTAFYGLKLVLQNSGSDSQNVAISYKKLTASAGTSLNDLHSKLVTDDTGWASLPSGSGTVPWTTGISLPDNFYVYFPFYNNRVRLSCVEVAKIS
jgi:hypothetical protein